jgi:predicted membrane channel-forming protein YqfA (hemolysin III family)
MFIILPGSIHPFFKVGLCSQQRFVLTSIVTAAGAVGPHCAFCRMQTLRVFSNVLLLVLLGSAHAGM